MTLLGPHRRPRPGTRGPGGSSAAVVPDRRAPAAAPWSTTRAPRCARCACSAQPGADRPPAAPPRALARADRPAARLHPPRGVRRARGAARAVGADPRASEPVCHASRPAAVDALRVEYRRVLLRLAARDLAHHVGVDDAAAELSDLAAGTLEAALAIARPGGRGRRPRPGWRWSRWASAAATSSTTSPTST